MSNDDLAAAAVPPPTVQRCAGRPDPLDPDDIKTWGVLGSTAPETAFVNGYKTLCTQIADAGCSPNHPEYAETKREVCGTSAQYPRRQTFCRRKWEDVMTEERKRACCSGQETGFGKCDNLHCPGSSTCQTFMTNLCNKPENVDSKSCDAFCTQYPNVCRRAVQQKCQGTVLQGPFCREACKKFDCTLALREFYSKPETARDPVGGCFRDEAWQKVEADLKKRWPISTALRHCVFSPCATNEESRGLLAAGAPNGRLAECPPACLQIIRSNLDNTDAKWVELMNLCIAGRNSNKPPPGDDDDDDENKVPGETVDERLMRLAEEAAARKRRRRNIIIWTSVAVGILIFVIVIVVVIRARKKAKAA